MCRDFDVHCQTVNDMANHVTSTFSPDFRALSVWLFSSCFSDMASDGLVSNSDSPETDRSVDEEVGRIDIFSPPLCKRPKRQNVAVTCQQLVRSLRSRWGLSEFICRVLEGKYRFLICLKNH